MENFLIKLAVLVFATWLIDTAYGNEKRLCPNHLYRGGGDYRLAHPYQMNYPCGDRSDCPNYDKQCCLSTEKMQVSLCHNLVKSEGKSPTCPNQLFKPEEREKFKHHETNQACMYDTDCTEEQCCIEVTKMYAENPRFFACHYLSRHDKNDTLIPLPPTISSCPDERSCEKNSVACSDDIDCQKDPEVSKLVDAGKYGCCHSSPGCCVKATGWACRHCDKVEQPKTCTKTCEYYEDHHPPAANPCGEGEVCCKAKHGCCVKKLHSNRRLSDDDQKICIKVRTRPSKRYEEASFTATINVKDGYVMNSRCTRSAETYCSEAFNGVKNLKMRKMLDEVNE